MVNQIGCIIASYPGHLNEGTAQRNFSGPVLLEVLKQVHNHNLHPIVLVYDCTHKMKKWVPLPDEIVDLCDIITMHNRNKHFYASIADGVMMGLNYFLQLDIPYTFKFNGDHLWFNGKQSCLRNIEEMVELANNHGLIIPQYNDQHEIIST